MTTILESHMITWVKVKKLKTKHLHNIYSCLLSIIVILSFWRNKSCIAQYEKIGH